MRSGENGVKCQCEASTHKHRGRTKYGFTYCENEATEKVLTDYGTYLLCKKCADLYDKAGYTLKREKLHPNLNGVLRY